MTGTDARSPLERLKILAARSGLLRRARRRMRAATSPQDPAATRLAGRLTGADAQAAVERFLGTFAFTRQGGIEGLDEATPLQVGQLVEELGWRAIVKGRIDVVTSATPDAWFNVILNGVKMALPRYTLMTIRNCMSAGIDAQLVLDVETAHYQRMKSEMRDGGLFLDIGAAAGTITVPMAMSGDPGWRIAAFEPSARARGMLQATLERNGAGAAVTVLDHALSDADGSLDFVELPEDPTGDTPFLPEGSRLAVEDEPLAYADQKVYSVPVTTLDALSERLDLAGASHIVAKIDVEGFEDKVLQGAMETLKRHKPFLSIDIHAHPGTDIQTHDACVAILEPLGYRIERLGHVMLANAG